MSKKFKNNSSFPSKKAFKLIVDDWRYKKRARKGKIQAAILIGDPDLMLHVSDSSDEEWIDGEHNPNYLIPEGSWWGIGGKAKGKGGKIWCSTYLGGV